MIKFQTLEDAIHVDKDNGTSVDYFIFSEYEIHLNRIAPHTMQEWHYHSKIEETLLVLKGQLLCRYLEGDAEGSRYVHEKELVQVGQSVHTFENDSDEEVEFVVFRFVPDGKDKRELIKHDKKVFTVS